MFVDVYIFLPFTVFLYMDAWEKWAYLFFYISYILTVPVDSALVSHSRSLSLNGSRTRLIPLPMSTALSGYSMWCVVRRPTSSSNPLVTALFILKKKKHEECEGCVHVHVNVCVCICVDTVCTGTRSHENQWVRRVQNAASCQSSQPLHNYGNVRARAPNL